MEIWKVGESILLLFFNISVFRGWYEVTQDSKYWSSKKLIINRSNYQEALRSERLKLMENVEVVDSTFYKEPKAAEEIINFFVNNLDSIKLQNLELNAYFPSDFDGEILAILASSIKSLTDYSNLEGDVIKPILKRVGRYESKTEQLVIYVYYVSPWIPDEDRSFPIKMPSKTIASLMGLSEVTLRNGLLSPFQIHSFLENFSMMTPKKLKKLDLSYSVLQEVEPNILARSVCLLETAIIRGCALTFAQVNAIAQEILMEEDADWFCLKHLDLAENNNQRHADTQLLATALSRIETVNMKEYNPKPPSHLSEHLFNEITLDEDSKIRQLQLSDVPLRPFLSKLEKIHFNEAIFHPDVLVNCLIEENSKLKTLEIENGESFESVFLTKPFFHLDHLRIESTKLARGQTREIFASKNSFKSLEIVNVDLFQPDSRTLANFVCSGVEKVNISHCKLTSSHVRAILQKIVERHQEGSPLKLQSLGLEYRGRSLERDLTDRVRSLVKLKITRTEVDGDPIKLKDDANLAFKAGKHDLALEKFSDAIELTNSKKDKALFLRNRSAVQFKMKNFAAAIEDSTSSLELAPKDPTALTRRGLAYEKTNQKDLASIDIRLASTLDPNNAAIKKILLKLQK